MGHADLRKLVDVRNLFVDFQPEVVFHLAAMPNALDSITNAKAHFENNVIGSINLLDACAALPKPPQVVFSSSGGAIYGEVPSGSMATENDVPSPATPYGVGKLTVEGLLDCYRIHSGAQAVSLRYGNVYGPRQRPNGEAGVVSIFIERALRGNVLMVYGDCRRDYVYVDDVVRANLSCMNGDVCSPHVINVGGKQQTTMDLALLIVDEVAKIQGRTTTAPVAKAAPRPGDVRNSVLSHSRQLARGWAITALDVGIERTIRWHMSQK